MSSSIKKTLRKVFLTDISKIGKKIIFSYFVVVIVSTLIFTLVSRSYFTSQITDRVLADLAKDADFIAEQISGIFQECQGEDRPEEIFDIKEQIFSRNVIGIGDLLAQGKLVFPSSRFSAMRVFVLDMGRNIAYDSLDQSIGKKYEAKSDRDYFVQERPLYGLNSEDPVGYVVLLAEKEDSRITSGWISSSVLLGIFSTLLISILLAFFFEQSIIGPINKLRANISSFSLEQENIEWETIETRDELSDINEDFLKLVNKLKVYDKKQKEFFQNTSHELKTPLMSIQGYAEAIKDGVLEEELIDEGLDIIIDESKRLRDTLNSIVYLGKVNTEEPKELTRICLWDFVDELASKLAGIPKERFIQVLNFLPRDLSIETNEDDLERIFSNIISNAMRYAQSKIQVSGRKRGEDRFVIVFEDDGRGFEEGEEELIFDRFYKGKGGNTGLGMSIVKSIAEANGWSIKAGKARIGGACIELILPIEDCFGIERCPEEGRDG